MKLTGKAKEKFEKWYFSLPNAMGLNYGTIALTMNRFYCLPESMQWGVIQDWADSIGYDVSAFNTSDDYTWLITDKRIKSEIWEEGFANTRQEARNDAIEKLNEIINKQ